MNRITCYGMGVLLLIALTTVSAMAHGPSIRLELLGTYSSGVFADGAAEITAYDPFTRRLFAVNADSGGIDIISIADPENPVRIGSIDVTAYGSGANSVDVRNGILAAAVEANTKTDNGSVVFFNTNGVFLNSVPAGPLPDMLTFTPDGKYLLVANEGEPNDDYSVDPEGSVTIVNLRHGVFAATAATAGFTSFNGGTIDPRIRIFGPGASVAQDLEPEYITVSADSRKAWVVLQENNALAVVDIRNADVDALVALGFKDHGISGNGIDASDRDGAINIANWPVFGMFQPDAIASFKRGRNEYLITVGEGDSRDYDTFSEEDRIKDLVLDPTAFPNAADLQEDEAIGRLNVTNTLGDTDGDGDFDALYAFGSRSFSIWSTSGSLIFDSGDALEQITAAANPDFFNSDNEENNFDNRSDNKGPEPEAVTTGSILGRDYAFIGLERVGGLVVYDVSNPHSPRFQQYINNRNFLGDPEAGTAGDLGPEGVFFIPWYQSPNLRPLVVVSNEISGSVSVYQVKRRFFFGWI